MWREYQSQAYLTSFFNLKRCGFGKRLIWIQIFERAAWAKSHSFRGGSKRAIKANAKGSFSFLIYLKRGISFLKERGASGGLLGGEVLNKLINARKIICNHLIFSWLVDF